MRTLSTLPLVLLLLLLVGQWARCFEFFIDGERKGETVESRITARFAHTTVRSSVRNTGSKAQSIGFNVQVPKRAFITNFTMNVNGITFLGSVKEKTDMETFKTEVHVPPGSDIEFELHYQEMMHRKLGSYEHSLHLQPGRLVPKLQVDVYIYEPKGISFVRSSNGFGEQLTGLTKVNTTKDKAHVVFKPTLQQQRKCHNCTDSAVDGLFTVMYDVSDGHFVQFFAPSDLTPLPKNIVFVIDVSGSMWGVKMKQTFDRLSGPTGTNINEALMRAVQMLLKASKQRLIDPRSVSMIILIKLSTIQKNMKRVMREEFSLFSLGIGFDVDYDFLERIAMENRGVAQRIYANHGASEQLRRFYSQVSSPLLRQIAIRFPEDSVSDVTNNRFDKFFAGSELVVAGKVQPSVDGTTLTSFTTASGASMDLTLQTEAEMDELDTKLAGQQHSFTGFARQMWAYITVNQLIAERSLAPTALKKRKITHRILNLAVAHQFVTPLTALLVESEETGERLLADYPKDPKHGCCSGTGVANPVRLTYSVPPPWVQRTTMPPPSQVEGPLPERITIVENDPHFIVHLPRAQMDVTIVKDSHVMVSVNSDVRVMVLLHRVWKKHPVNVDYLGVYFWVEPDVKVYDVHQGADPLKQEATMEVKGLQLSVTRGWQKDYRQDRKHGSDVYCWFVHNSGKGFIDHHYTRYIVPHLDSFLQVA
ncbi:hypothetical protein CRUP_023126 [Coryphaenoides rupestris]|nr:hypothetical protein CRUP_023126 [Coryphaenoides rupestris]